MSDNWWGGSIQEALLKAEIVSEERANTVGPSELFYLKLDTKLIPLGADKHFADLLRFALVRNAEAFEREINRQRQQHEAIAQALDDGRIASCDAGIS